MMKFQMSKELGRQRELLEIGDKNVKGKKGAHNKSGVSIIGQSQRNFQVGDLGVKLF